MLKHLVPWAALMGASLAQAHPGHGLPGSAHWHAGDTGLLLGLALVVGLAISWLGRRP